MPPERILILGGTGLARAAASALLAHKVHVVSALAGVTQNPHLPEGEIRKGGFGGVEGLGTYVRLGKFDWVVDATHPFAAQMATHAVAACALARVKLLRLEQPPWVAQSGDQWRHVDTVAAAVAAIPNGAKVAITLGRKEIGRFFARSDLGGIARMIEPPAVPVPSGWQIMLQRPPFMLEHEIDWLRDNQIEILVSKNAGGVRVPKLDAAAALRLPVIMLVRTGKPVAETVASVAELLGRLGLAG